MVSLYSVAYVDPEVLQIVLDRLCSAEFKLSMTFFLLHIGSAQYIFKEDLGVAPSVRQNGVG